MTSRHKAKRTSNRREEKRQARRTLAVGLAFARTQCLFEILLEEIGKAKAEGILGPSAGDWQMLRVNRATRSAALIFAFYTSLQTVVDGWRRNHIKDEAVDALLSSIHTSVLTEFRNAVAHPTGSADERFTEMQKFHGELMSWMMQLMAAFHRFFTVWFLGLGSRMGVAQTVSEPSES